MGKYLLSIAAKQDLLRIQNYTTEKWGNLQASKYLVLLRNRIRWLAEHPYFGKRRDDIFDRLYSYPEGSHLIIYRLRPGKIQIVRILHQSMDYEIQCSPETPGIQETPARYLTPQAAVMNL